MGERERAERAEPLAEVDWGDVFARAVALARSFVREQDIDDVVAEGVARLSEGSATYDPEVDGQLAMRVVEVGRAAIRGELRKVLRRVSGNFMLSGGVAVPGPGLSGPDESVGEVEVLREQKAEVLRRLMAECADDPDAMDVIDCALLSIEGAEDQALATGTSNEDVVRAIERVRRKLDGLLRDEARRVGALDEAGLGRDLAAMGRTLEGERAKGQSLVQSARTKTTSGFRPRSGSGSLWWAYSHGGSRRPTLAWLLVAAAALAGGLAFVERAAIVTRFTGVDAGK